MKVLGLYDGLSCGQIALERAGIEYDIYYASEIDKYAIEITQKNYPNTIQLGDITTLDFSRFKGKVDIVIGGSPCTHWSIANKNREITSSGLGFELFMHFVKAIEEIQPKYFLYENNERIHKNIKSEITKYLGVQPILIDSALVSAQQRKRLYWTNIPNVDQPQDKKIYLKDVLEIKTDKPSQDKIVMTKSNFKVKVRKHYIDKKELAIFLREHKKNASVTNREIAEYCDVPLTKVEHWFRLDNSFSIPDEDVWDKLKEIINIQDDKYDKQITEFEIKNNNFDMAKRIYDINGKHPTLTTLTGGGQRKTITDGEDLFYLEPIHCERLQTVPDNYTEGVSDRQRFKMLGNGWTVDVVAHILKHIKGKE